MLREIRRQGGAILNKRISPRGKRENAPCQMGRARFTIDKEKEKRSSARNRGRREEKIEKEKKTMIEKNSRSGGQAPWGEGIKEI